MSLDIPLPKQVFGHPWLLFGNDKMSKSKGNIMYADDLVNYFGVDAVRYYVLHEIPYANDGTITYDTLIDKINSDLANILGNLVNRTISMANKYFDGKVINTKLTESLDKDLLDSIDSLEGKIEDRMDRLEIGAAIDEIFEVLRKSNKYIDDTTPWVLSKDENSKDRLKTVIYNLLEAIRVCSISLEPFLPSTAEEIKRQLNTSDISPKYNQENIYNTITPMPLFVRIDKDAKLKGIENKG